MDLDFFTSNMASAINVHQKYKLNPINAKRKTHNFSIFANSVGESHTNTQIMHTNATFRCKFYE